MKTLQQSRDFRKKKKECSDVKSLQDRCFKNAAGVGCAEFPLHMHKSVQTFNSALIEIVADKTDSVELENQRVSNCCFCLCLSFSADSCEPNRRAV